jgi:hypothetical protein
MMRLDVQRIGAACAIAYAVLIFATLALYTSSGVATANGAAEFLPLLDAKPTIAATVSILFIVMPLLIAVAGIGLFRMLQDGGPIAWLALFGFVGGGLSIIYRGFIWLAMTLELAPAYVHADAAGQAPLATVGDTLQVFSAGATMVGAVLVAGIGILASSVVMYRMRLGPRWLAWLGVFAAFIGGWLTLLTKVSDVAANVSGIGNLVAFLWFAAVGVIAWRRAVPAAQSVPRTTIGQHPEAVTG